MIRPLLCAVMFLAASCAHAQSPAPSPGAASTPSAAPGPGPECGALMGGGSADVAVGGASAWRLGDQTCVRVIDHSHNVFINGRPALRVGDRVQCPDGRIGVIVGGAASVKINGLPAATAASRIQGCD